jgi:hypothetical protein
LAELLTRTFSTFWIGASVLHAVSAVAAASTASHLEIRTMDPPVVVTDDTLAHRHRNHPRD